MPGYKVNYKDFNPANIIAGKTDSYDAIGEDGKAIKYFRIPILYNYEVKKADGSTGYARSELYIEGPREKSKGPTTKDFAQGGKTKTVHSIITRYDLNKQEHFDFINRDASKPGTIHKLAMGCCQIVYDKSSEVGINDCPHPDMMMYKLHYPVKWKMDKGLPIPGENPAGLWKLFRYGKEPYVKETSFFLPGSAKPVNWGLISSAEIDHLPVFKVDNITIAGGRPSIKIELASSVIYDIIAGGGNKIQEETLKEVSKDTILVAKLQEQIRQLEEAAAKMNISNNPVGAGSAASQQSVPVINQVTAPNTPEPAFTPAPAIPINLPGLSFSAPAPAPVQATTNNLSAMLNSAPVLSIPGGPVLDLPPLP
jgi:hypothetical protein